MKEKRIKIKSNGKSLTRKNTEENKNLQGTSWLQVPPCVNTAGMCRSEGTAAAFIERRGPHPRMLKVPSEEQGSGREGRSGAAWAWFTLQRLLTFGAPRASGSPPCATLPRATPGRPTQIREIDGGRQKETHARVN